MGGQLADWFEPFLFSMQYTASKETSKINAAAILKAITELGCQNYANILVTPRDTQLPMDWLLRIITAKLDPIE